MSRLRGSIAFSTKASRRVRLYPILRRPTSSPFTCSLRQGGAGDSPFPAGHVFVSACNYNTIFSFIIGDEKGRPYKGYKKVGYEIVGILFIGRLQYISRFIAQLAPICEPIFKLLRKNKPKELHADCQYAFEKIKQYLTNPPILSPPVSGKPLILYLSTTHSSMGGVLGQHDDSGRKERAIYYLSRKFNPNSVKYPEIEKVCLALVWATQRLKQYVLYNTVLLISKQDPLKYLCQKTVLTGRLARWQWRIYRPSISPQWTGIGYLVILSPFLTGLSLRRCGYLALYPLGSCSIVTSFSIWFHCNCAAPSCGMGDMESPQSSPPW